MLKTTNGSNRSQTKCESKFHRCVSSARAAKAGKAGNYQLMQTQEQVNQVCVPFARLRLFFCCCCFLTIVRLLVSCETTLRKFWNATRSLETLKTRQVIIVLRCAHGQDQLRDGAQRFEKKAVKLKRKMWWKNMKVCKAFLLVFTHYQKTVCVFFASQVVSQSSSC